MRSGPDFTSLEVGGVRARALTAASHILATRGPEKLSLRAIAESAGIGTTSIYHYFANKDELLLNLALMGFRDLHRQIVKFQTSPEYDNAMQASARAFFDFAETHPALFSLMFSERLMARHVSLRDAEYETFLAYQAVVEADERMPAGQRPNVAYALWALGRGIAAIMSSYPDGKLPPEIAERLFAGASYLINRRE
ncbi:MAG: hypothetical protein CMI59_16315 [Parvibaculum sp.]|nr:hypothetical protein [Parvibaculum sp.]